MSVRIVLVDDNPTFLRIAARFLASQPDVSVVGMARTAREAIRCSHELQPDVVLMDASVTLGGRSTTSVLRQQPNAPFVVLTSLSDDGQQRAAALSQADAFVSKRDFGIVLPPLLSWLGKGGFHEGSHGGSHGSSHGGSHGSDGGSHGGSHSGSHGSRAGSHGGSKRSRGGSIGSRGSSDGSS